MATRARIVGVGTVLAASLLAASAGAANVTVSATVTGGSTLSVASLNMPGFSLTLNGDDQTGTYQAQLQVVDARGLGTGGGWNLTIGGTRFTAGANTLPANASTITAVTAACHSGSTCAVPVNGVANTSLAIPTSPTAAKFVNAASASGLGRIDLGVNVSVTVPASTVAGSYASTLTVAVAAGP